MTQFRRLESADARQVPQPATEARMTTTLPGPDCTTMTEVRAGVDQVDRELVALLARRFAYMDAAARIKPARGAVRDEGRKAQVIANARAAAEAAGCRRRDRGSVGAAGRSLDRL